MKNRWIESDANRHAVDEHVGLRVYSSRLLGQDADLVLHGGGNTSVKGELTDVFGDSESVLFVKGSGWDLRTIEAPGFPPVKLDYLLKLGELEQMGDSEMMRQLRLALMDPTAPTPSVEAILHALIPHKYVDHSHADAVVAISNTANGEAILREIYGEKVLVLPYVMPGFILARQVAEATRDLDWSSIRGIILLHHGIFTFDADAKSSYDSMIELVSLAEDYLEKACASKYPGAEGRYFLSQQYLPSQQDCVQLAELRRQAGACYGRPVLLRLDSSPEAAHFAGLDSCHELATRGPLTPDHTIHAKPFAAVLEQDPIAGLRQFEEDYQQYFDQHSSEIHQCLDRMPRYAVWRNKGMVYLAANQKKLQIVQDISQHTIKAIQLGEVLGGWQALSRQELFDVEYWELEQAKLKSSAAVAEFEGKVVVVSGAASGIGKACVEEFVSKGAMVLALDIAADFETSFTTASVLAVRSDVTDQAALDSALQQAVLYFGGIDVLVSNAGNFPESQQLESMQDENWERSLELNLSSHMKVMRASLPYLKQGFDPAIVIIASKNVPAPGPGAAAYSAAKAGLTQLARVAALELGENGIRVNALHPNAVYDTAIWTDEVLARRAEHYQMSIEQYKSANVLKTEVKSTDVAAAVAVFAGNTLAKTTGAQLPVDGGNDRVI